MANNKPAFSIEDQIQLLKQRGMLFRDEQLAPHFFANISYYRLKGYWWDMQEDLQSHNFKADTFFEDIIGSPVFFQVHKQKSLL